MNYDRYLTFPFCLPIALILRRANKPLTTVSAVIMMVLGVLGRSSIGIRIAAW